MRGSGQMPREGTIRVLRKELEACDGPPELVKALEITLEHFETTPEVDYGSMIKEGIKAVLEAESPLHYSQMWDRLSQRGTVVTSEYPEKVIIWHLGHDTRFKKLGLGIWGLSSCQSGGRSSARLPTQRG